jgi:hypothetical protein
VVGGAAIHDGPRRLARMQLDLHGVEADLDDDAIRRLTRAGDADDRYDLVFSNPPFNMTWRDDDTVVPPCPAPVVVLGHPAGHLPDPLCRWVPGWRSSA